MWLAVSVLVVLELMASSSHRFACWFMFIRWVWMPSFRFRRGWGVSVKVVMCFMEEFRR